MCTRLKKRRTPLQGDPYKKYFSWGPGATGEPTAEISTKGRDGQVVRNLPKVIPRTLLSRVSSFDIPCRQPAVLTHPRKEKV
jgi:hypothetical protein